MSKRRQAAPRPKGEPHRIPDPAADELEAIAVGDEILVVLNGVLVEKAPLGSGRDWIVRITGGPRRSSPQPQMPEWLADAETPIAPDRVHRLSKVVRSTLDAEMARRLVEEPRVSVPEPLPEGTPEPHEWKTRIRPKAAP